MRNIIKSTFIVFLFLLFTGLQAQVADLKQVIPFDTTVTYGTLANGLKYYIKPNAKPEKKVELRLVVNAGSILENDNQQGLAHFMEHMNFNGTEHYPKNELVDFLQSIGVQFGADLNAYTGFDETVFILPIPTDKPDNLEKGFVVISDWAQKALITDKDVDDERKVVLEESRMGKGAEDRMMKIYLPKLLAGSHYADRLPIGKDEILKTFPPDVIRQFYKDWYRPDLMAVAVVGDVTTDQAKALIEKYFAGLKNPENEKPRTAFEVPAFKKKEALVLTDKENTNESFTLVYSSRKKSIDNTAEDYRNSIIKNLFIQIMNDRLNDLTESSNPPFLYSYCYIGGWARGYENFQLGGVASGDLKTSLNAAIGELVKAQKFGFNKTELEVAKKATLSYIEKMYNERKTTESGRIIEEYLRNFLQHEPMPGIAADYKYYTTFIPGITLEEVNAIAKKWLSENQNYFAMYQAPENAKSKKISNKVLMKMVESAFKQKVKPNVEKTIAAALLTTEPVAGAIVADAKDSSLGTTTFNLSNGVSVTIKKTDFKSDEIIFSGHKKGGTGNYGVSDKMNIAYMTSIISSMNYGIFTPVDLQKYMSGKNASVNMSMSATENNISGRSTIKDLETMLQLNYLKLTAANKNEELYKGYLAQMISSMENQKSDPQTAFFDTFYRALYNNQPMAPVTIPSESQLKSIDVNRVLEIYKNEFSFADGYHFFFVGNIDENTLKPLLEKYLASLPVSGTLPQLKDNGLRPVSGKNQLNIHLGKEQKSLILDQYYGEMPYTQDAAFKASLMADILNIKIIEELREKIGGIYSGGMYANLVKNPYSHYSVVLYLPCGPESVDTLLKAAAAELTRIKLEGPSEKDLAKVKTARIEMLRESLKTNSFWISSLHGIMMDGNDKNRILDYLNVVNNVTADDIKNIANLMLSGDNHFQAVLYPEK